MSQPQLITLLSLPGIKAQSTLRSLPPGQEPRGPYDGWSLCDYTGDSPRHTGACHHGLAHTLGATDDSIIAPRQTHSANAVAVDSPALLTDVDGLATRTPGLIIGVNTADCVPVVMADPVARVVGVAHCGWRGALAGTHINTLGRMAELGAHAGDIRVAFGPSICPDCFEVGPEVAEQFPAEVVIRRPEWPRPHVDLHRYLTLTLEANGIPALNITPFDPGLCTRHHPVRFFSARASGVRSGRVFTFAYLDSV